MRSQQNLFQRWLAVGAVAAFTLSAPAQSNRGAVSGSVLDSTGAVVPEAQITATNNQNGAVYKTVSTGTGSYQIQQMALGTYTIQVTASGFSTAVQTGVLVQIAQVTGLDIKLAIGQSSQTVTVEASGATLQTQTSDIGTVVDAKQIVDLPLALGGQSGLRAPEAFVFLTPGTVGYGSGSGAGGPGSFFKTSGGQNFATEVILDGASTYRDDAGSTFDQTAPSVEAISEFNIITSTLPAQYGRTSGGIEIFSTKSGSNAYHGKAFEIYRNEALDANGLFNNIRKSMGGDPNTFRRPKDRQNDFGGTFGGPVSIPHLYNGQDKTFFFFAWEAYRRNNGAVITSTVPTDAIRSGDFSSYLGAPLLDANHNPVINPCDGRPVFTNEIFDPSTERTVGGVRCRSAFPGNKIDPSRFSTVAKNTLALFPQPTDPTVAVNNFSLASSSPLANTTYTFRIDQNLGPSNKFYFSYTGRENTNPINPQFTGALDTTTKNDFIAHYLRFGYDHTFSPTLLNQFTLGYNRINNSNFAPGILAGQSATSVLGVTNINGNAISSFQYNDGVTNISNTGNTQNNDVIDNGYRVNDSLSKSLGRHTVTVGGDFRYQIFDPLSHDQESGSFNFGRSETAFTNNTTGQTGIGFASFLLGQVDEGQLADHSAGQPKWLETYGAVFGQDDWKINPELTLNLGLRWDVELPRRERDGNTSNFSATAPNPGANGRPGALVFAGTGAGRNGNVNERWANIWTKDFAPRIGFAYTPRYFGSKTTFRGGFGIYYDALHYADNGGSLRDGFTGYPIRQSQNGYDAAFNIDNGYPSYPKPPSLDPTQDNNGSIDYIAPSNGRPGTVYNWSAQLQQQLANDLIFSLGYVGQHSTNLHSTFSSLNNLPVRYFALGTALNGTATATTPGGIPFAGFPGNAPVAQALRPFPQYGRINQDCCLENEGMASFDALEAKLQRHFRNGLNLLASYTFSKTITDSDSADPFLAIITTSPGSPQDPENKRGEKSISTQDLPQNFVVSYLYELPIGKGKRFLAKNPVIANVVGGITIGGVQRYESGQPYSFGNNGVTGIPAFDEAIRFNRVPGQPLYDPVFKRGHYNPLTTHVFNPAAFSNPNSPANMAARGGAYGFGDLPRVTGEIRTNIYKDEDFSFIKRTRFGERFDVDLKVNFLNAFNRKILNRAGSNGPGDSQFGITGGTILGPRQIQPELRLEF